MKPPAGSVLQRLLQRQTPREAQADMTWLERAWEGAQNAISERFDRPGPDLSPISRGLDPFGHPIYADSVETSQFDLSRFGIDPATGRPMEMMLLGDHLMGPLANLHAWMDHKPRERVATGETEEVELAGMTELQARDRPNVRQRDDGTWVFDREITEMRDAPPFAYDPDLSYLDVAEERGFEGPRAFLAALGMAMFEPGPGDLFRAVALPWGHLVNRVRMKGVAQVLEESLATRTRMNIQPLTRDAAEGFEQAIRRLAADPSLSNAYAKDGTLLGQRAVWTVSDRNLAGGVTFTLRTPGFDLNPTSDAQRGLIMKFELRYTTDASGAARPYVYVNAMQRNTLRLGQNWELPTAYLDLLDAWGLPSTTTPAAFGGYESVLRRHNREGILYTPELEAMYNRLGFQQRTAVAPDARRAYDNASGLTLRMPAEAGSAPDIELRRLADLDARVDPQVIARGKAATTQRLADEAAYRTAQQNQSAVQALNQVQPGFAPQDFFDRHAVANTRSAFHQGSVRRTVPNPLGGSSSRLPNPRYAIASSVNDHGGSDWLPTVFQDFLDAAGTDNVMLASTLSQVDPRTVFNVSSFDPAQAGAYLRTDVFPQVAENMRSNLGVPENLIEEFFTALARVWSP